MADLPTGAATMAPGGSAATPRENIMRLLGVPGAATAAPPSAMSAEAGATLPGLQLPAEKPKRRATRKKTAGLPAEMRAPDSAGIAAPGVGGTPPTPGAQLVGLAAEAAMPSGFYPSALATNAKLGFEGRLHDCVLITGPNRAGKSTVLVGLRLAMQRAHVDLGKVPSALMQLAPRGEKKLRASVQLTPAGAPPGDASSVLHAVWEGSTRRASEASVSLEPVGALSQFAVAQPELITCEFLAEEVRALLKKRPADQREAWLALIAPRDLTALARERVPQVFEATFDAVLKEAAQDGDSGAIEADRIKLAVEIAGTWLKTARDTANDASIETEPPSAPSDEAIAQADQRLQAARAASIAVDKRAAAAGMWHRLNTELQAARERVHQLTGATDNLLAVAGLPPAEKVNEAEQLFRAAQGMLVADPTSPGTHFCLACQRGLTGNQLDQVRAHLEERLRTMASIRAQIVQAQNAAGAGNALADAQQRLAAIERDMAGALAVANAAVADEGLIPHLPQLEIDLQEARRRKDAERAFLARRAAARTAAASLRELDAVLGALKEAITSGLERAKDVFMEEVNALLPAGRRIDLQLYDGAKPVCRVGHASAGGTVRPWQVLSGAERAECVAALATAWSRRSRAAVRIVEVDDVDLDDESLLALCAKLRACVGLPGGPTMAVIAKVAVPATLPPGWLHLHRGAVAG